MNTSECLEILPLNFRHEKDFLSTSKFNSLVKLRDLKDSEINMIMSKNSLCTASRLKKIRSMAIFMSDLNMQPHHAFILMHCGISNLKALSSLEPYVIETRINRFKRTLRLKDNNSITLRTIKGWITKAKELI